MSEKQTLGEFLKELREKNAYSQADVSKALDTSIPEISQWENGKHIPNAYKLRAIAKFYKLDVVELTSRK